MAQLKASGYAFFNNLEVISEPVMTNNILSFQTNYDGLTVGVACCGDAANLTVSKGDLVSLHGGIFSKAKSSDFAVQIFSISQISVCVTDYGFNDLDKNPE